MRNYFGILLKKVLRNITTKNSYFFTKPFTFLKPVINKTATNPNAIPTPNSATVDGMLCGIKW